MHSNVMKYQVSCDTASILHEFDLGHHTLLLMSDGSSEMLARDEHPSDLAAIGIRLDREETYRLFISLHAQFHQP